MTNPQALGDRISKITDELEQIEKDLHSCAVSAPLLDDLKSAVDHLRTTLFAIMSGDSSESANATIVKLRLKRAIQISQQIRLDIDATEITVDIPDVPLLRDSFEQTVSRIERLLASGL